MGVLRDKISKLIDVELSTGKLLKATACFVDTRSLFDTVYLISRSSSDDIFWPFWTTHGRYFAGSYKFSRTILPLAFFDWRSLVMVFFR